ncbi:MAG: hypothetical protein DWQ34_11715 [Planctomycetota bacterium]|nr:MAG: hypothetical protein DWQ29_07755 [Planctomycetota bacterium]REJ93127.1 MAG: hypothetical protein DWQ34_11715 [Planctomycetota bacterium]REK30116.1 MAG: hypothetical protein DWQ41_03020 [Planctomycetota bacterium]REK37641.1 MAG: hypothetical protein DWQ45_06505 [Planctomycetota bacterium]
MSTTAERLFSEALELPDAERAALAARLIESLDSEAEEDAAEKWETEIRRRVEELDSGAVRPIPWSEVRRTMLGLE